MRDKLKQKWRPFFTNNIILLNLLTKAKIYHLNGISKSKHLFVDETWHFLDEIPVFATKHKKSLSPAKTRLKTIESNKMCV